MTGRVPERSGAARSRPRRRPGTKPATGVTAACLGADRGCARVQVASGGAGRGRTVQGLAGHQEEFSL